MPTHNFYNRLSSLLAILISIGRVFRSNIGHPDELVLQTNNKYIFGLVHPKYCVEHTYGKKGLLLP